jgi:beta-glucosidase
MNRIDLLLRKMSMPEKLGQLTMSAAGHAVTGPTIAGDSTEAIKAGTVGNLLNLLGAEQVREMQRLAVKESRLGIPLLIGFDVLHGHRTLFPIPLAEAGLFDPETWALTAREAAKEATADGVAMTFAPMLDVARDPRWGRSAEGPGEDPWLSARIAEVKVRGFQGADLAAADALAAVAKHFCAYGAVTAGRDYAAVDISDRTLHEVYLPAFAAAVAAGVSAVMPAFTDLAGIPMTANLAQAATLALKAGVDIDMMAGAYRHGLPLALERGWVSVEEIDASVRRVLTLKLRLGLFDDPYRRGRAAQKPAALSSRRRLARSVGARAIVLLKNDEGVLPLRGGLQRLAVVGPLADAAAEMRGPWWGAAPADESVTVVAGLRGALADGEVLHSPGVEIDGENLTGMAEALEVCARADAIVLCLGEAAGMSGEAASRAQLGLPGRQRILAEAVFEGAAAQGKPVIVVLFSGRPLAVPWLIERAGAVLAAWFLGSEAGNAIADVITGKVGPSGRTAVTWPRASGQVPLFFGERPSGRRADPKDRFTSKYLDVANEPLFPFGFGLSYGRFTFSNLRLTTERVTEKDTVVVRVDVLNDGARAAEETVFLFTHDKLATVTRPLLELKGFAKIKLDPGQTGTVTLFLAATELRFLGVDLRPVFEPREVEILVGPCADRARLLAGTIHLGGLEPG